MQVKWVILILVAAAWAAFTWWTVRRVWRNVKAREGEPLLVDVVLVILMTTFIAFRTPVVMPMPPFEYWQLVGFWAFLWFPLSIWILHISAIVIRAFAGWYYPKE